MAKSSKRIRGLVAKLPGKGPFPLPEAVKLLKTFNNTKFDQTVEIAIRLGIDAKQADQLVRGSVVLPHGIGRTLRVVVFAKGDKLDEATEAGADEVGGPELAERIKGGWTDFDVCIAAPDMMGIVGPLGRILGPRGLMPSPRAGTVTPDVGKTVREYKAGKVEFRNDSGGNVHAVVGKLSFDGEKLAENIQSFIDYVQSLKPAAVRGQYVRGISISATMSPGVRLAL
ncbi:MAG: 50S ribosomal protein L1 [Pirellulales bacterium]|jgi:large subunit ribosomal protein L1|nr:50S ribosomal protein L1 [Thermoguttaceae bacterium]MDD4788933.1 50S ribosomal protein L1 [Pirellulales bacterium]MDI9446814.1 50S ribosomal protein L1 [Planctomycetota bacterium]NLY99593.1 50S ribosomal protein L1 [Pirellulaceae bacterium]